MPKSQLFFLTVSINDSKCVDPQLSLILIPLGALCIAITSAPALE